MHGTGLLTAIGNLLAGGSVALLEKPGFEALQFALLTSLKQARYTARAEPHYALAFHPYCHSVWKLPSLSSRR